MVVIILRALKHRDRPHFKTMIAGQKKGQPAPFRVFDMYEDRIIELLAKGYNQYEIAEEMPPLSEQNISKYRQKICQKWGAKNTPNLIHLWHLKQKSNA